ncbi:RNA polymerase sigma factor [Rhodohalobacter sp. 614A]|uniref:RNA polymerase sigma factor n=1 Tax=Rhodohalobacter sp. 614A TaxID=2908649 RepID=UPI001F2E1F97
MNNRIHIETDLVERVKRGDAGAFQQLVDQLMKPAYFHALAILRNHEDAVEISQETFIKVWKARKSINTSRPLYPWFYTILKNLCLNRNRDESRRKETAVSRLEYWTEPKGENNPSRDVLREEENRLIQQTLSKLDVNDREIIVMKDLEGYSYKEIAEMLGIPVGTVMSRLYTARQRFKTHMEEAGYEYS